MNWFIFIFIFFYFNISTYLPTIIYNITNPSLFPHSLQTHHDTKDQDRDGEGI
jgi:hypothetical protein